MRRLILRLAIAAIVLPTLWLFTARWCSGLLDRVYTVTQARLPNAHIGWNGARFQVGDTVDSMDGPRDGWNADLTQGSHILDPGPRARLGADPEHRLILTLADRTIVLGDPAGTMPGSDGPVPAYTPQPGDKVAVTVEHSLISWPTPFEVNFMTGYVHTWRRWLYFRLTWEKPSGQRLTMLWRYEQGYHQLDHWTRPYPADLQTGLIRVDIQPPR